MSLDLMRARMNAIGGSTSDGRINDGKLKSLRSAMRNSYQAEWITFKDKRYRCLINPVKLSTDYDQKEISIEFDSKMAVGEVFYWDRTDSWWMVIDQRLTEEAYFRGEIRQCDYEINTDNNRYWIWMRGPVETSLVWKQKHDINFNDMNYSLLFYIVKNEDTQEFFQRHRIVKFDNHNWLVAAVDRYTQENIIEVYLEEYSDNEMQDAQVIPEVEKVVKQGTYISGPQTFNPYDIGLKFTVNNAEGGTWVNPDFKKFSITDNGDGTCTVDVLTGKSGDFVLKYKKDNEIIAEIPIRISSL